MNIEEIRQRLTKFAEARNWTRFYSPKNLSIALAAEGGRTAPRHGRADRDRTASLEF
jgi:hypothetical protein